MRNTVAALLSEEETKNYYIDESRLADFRTKRRVSCSNNVES